MKKKTAATEASEAIVAIAEATAAPEDSEAPPAALLESLGVQDSDQLADSAFARVLLVGPAKAGKTACLASTAPSPLVINCDGPGASHGATVVASDHGRKFYNIDVCDRVGYRSACEAAMKLAEAGHVRTIILDTVTLLYDMLLAELSVAHDGFELWRELMNVGMRGVRYLMQAPAHVFIVAHALPGFDDGQGVLPAIPGQSAQRIPSLVHDPVLFVYDQLRGSEHPTAPNRFFALGPQDKWAYNGRHIKHSCQIPADVSELFAHMGIAE